LSELLTLWKSIVIWAGLEGGASGDAESDVALERYRSTREIRRPGQQYSAVMRCAVVNRCLNCFCIVRNTVAFCAISLNGADLLGIRLYCR
jgi:hypothetical protein